MANTTLGNLKIGALRRVHFYNSGDATGLALAGGIINDVLGYIQTQIKGSLYEHDLANTITTTANQAYVDLTDSNILEILNVYQTTTDTKLRRLSRQEFVLLQPDTTVFSGTPEYAYFPTQILTAGVNTWRVYLIPTPSSAISLSYDYIKSLQFSADGTSADAEYSALPRIFDDWIYSEFAPRWFKIVDPSNLQKIQVAESQAEKARRNYRSFIKQDIDGTPQIGSFRDQPVIINRFVKTTPAP